MPSVPEALSRPLADQYRLQREVGRGGMAIVYLAEDLKHGRQVAIKVLSPEYAMMVGRERFIREIEIAARLNHPNILPLFDSGAAGDRLYYVMPFVEGESLRARLERERRLPPDEALRMAREIAGALGYAHEQGVVHRDIKPENILLSQRIALVADFGIARALRTTGDEDPGSFVTRAGFLLGTPSYMSPEQVAGDEVDRRTDLYALACVLYEMLAGEPPFTGPTADSVLRAHLLAEPRPVSERCPAVSRRLAEAVSKGLAKTPADRYPSAAGFADALARATAAVEVPPFAWWVARALPAFARLDEHLRRSGAMTAAEKIGATTFSTPSDREVAVTRAFDAPLGLVWEAWTSPEQVPLWMLGPGGWSMPVCEIDLRPGGAWRFVWRHPDGGEMEMRGVYREITPPERLVHTESWGGDWPETVNTVAFSGKDATTSVSLTVLYPSREARDAALETGMKEGMSRSFERLDEVLAARRKGP